MANTCNANSKTIKSINTNISYVYPFKNDEDYQKCFLSVFDIEEFDEKIIEKKTKALLEEMKNNKMFCDILQCLAGKMFSTDLEIGLYMLFSFDYLHDFLETIKENKESYNFSDLLEKIQKS